MLGETVSHYRVVELLGAGGMGVVYKAEDSRLHRFVAIKFLPPELTLDPVAKARLIHEAQAASALDHPNICTIHEIDETPDGRVFVAMAYYAGQTLKERLAQGPLAVAEALTIAAQIARGVAAAHAEDIVHRDIKPANVMLTTTGEVKLLDFGLAKLAHAAMQTRTAAVVGTIAYMAPEQIAGLADTRTDVWALGVVLYEMLTGSPPFEREHEGALLNAILQDNAPSLAEGRPDAGSAVAHIVEKALQKDPNARFATGKEFAEAVERARVVSDERTRAAGPQLNRRRRRWIGVGALVTSALVASVWGWSVYHNRLVRRVTETALFEIRRQIAEDNYVGALITAGAAERIVGERPALSSLVHDASVVRDIRTDPAGASVWVRDPALRSDWMLLGTTPIQSARVPSAVLRWKIQRAGYEPEEFVRPVVRSQVAPALPDTLELTPAGSIPSRMTLVPAARLGLTLTGFDYSQTIDSGAYLVDKYEVTNSEFKEFVDAGGYQTRRFWTVPFRDGTRLLSWEQGMAAFHDQTGRPGPATWEVGTYPKGHDHYPVAGVSWYEAAAYAQFRGRALPTVYHWLHAAGTSASAHITSLSNFSGQPVATGQTAAVSPFGLHDVAGNVREWCFNELEPGKTRYILGGSAADPDYMFFFADARSPFDRSPVNGFRTVKYLNPTSVPEATTRPVASHARSYERAKPVSDEVFHAYTGLYAYDPVPLSASVELVDDRSPSWRRERVTFAATYNKDRVTAHVFLPKRGRPPYQTVLYWPGSGTILPPSSEPPLQMNVIDWLVLSGRAVVYPVYYGTYERHTERQSGWPDMSRDYADWVMKQVNDARRTLDYVQSRPDLRHDHIGFLGFSWGGVMGCLLLAVDQRFDAAVFLSAGFSSSDARPEVDAMNFAPHVARPVLMINGSQDYIVAVESTQKPMFRLLGTPPDRKRHVILPAGHAVIFDKRSDVIREGLDWFDRYLGSVR